MDWNSCLKNGIPQISCALVLFRIALYWAVGLSGVVALFLIIVAGFKYITSGGGKQVEEAQKTLTYAIIGLLVVLLGVFIINLIGGVTGVTCIFQFGFTNCH